jgi:hypothetical protein
MEQQKQIDLESLVSQGGKLSITTEPEDERKSRLIREEKDADHKRWKERTILLGASLLGIVVFMWCLFVLTDKTSSTEAKEVAKILLPALVAGLVGYLFGKSSKE